MKIAGRIAQVKPSLTLAITQKAKSMKAEGVDVVGFGAGEPDFDTPLHIKEAAKRAIDRGATKYTPASGTPELKRAICEKFERENGIKYVPEEIITSCGAKHSLYNIFQVICEKPDEVLIISPYWLSYPEMVHLAEGKPVFVTTDEKNAFVPSIDDINRKITQATKAIILNSPSNPTGSVLDRDFLEKIAEIAVAKKIFVISDEIYENLLYDGEKRISIASLGEKIKALSFTVNGVSKSYSMTGWRIGYLGGPKEIVSHMSAFQSHSTSNPASISQAAALDALKGSQAEVKEMKKAFVERRDYMVERINKIKGLSCVKPKGAFYLFCNIALTGLDSVALCDKLLEEAKVACVPGIAFGSDKYIRLSFATSIANIKKGLDRIENWLNNAKNNS
ncbi:MAG: pyridoxal phosphate-dependent aminotransferase [Candidatus Omnitrophica bacterium]|nr:pyridoxal phosphate-dependent aminotransferase [Candidatus Omnitrophota bacterium]